MTDITNEIRDGARQWAEEMSRRVTQGMPLTFPQDAARKFIMANLPALSLADQIRHIADECTASNSVKLFELARKVELMEQSPDAQGKFLTLREEVDALPYESVILDANNHVWEQWSDEGISDPDWYTPGVQGCEAESLISDIALPVQVLKMGHNE